MRLALALLVVVALPPAAMASHDPAPQAAFAPTKLLPIPKQVVVQCRLAKELRVCPARLPQPTIALRSTDPLPKLYAERYSASRNGDAVMVGIGFTYGAPWEPGSGSDWQHHLWRNRPCCFMHFDLWRSLAGTPPFPDRSQRATLAGRRGDLARASSWGMACGAGNAGVWFCNHTRFRWREAGVWYVATIHRFGMNDEDVRLLARLIRELRAA